MFETTQFPAGCDRIVVDLKQQSVEAVLDNPESAEGRAVLLEGIVGEGITENIGIIQIGEKQVFLFIPPKRAWGNTNFPNGTRVEVVALISGRQTLGERTLPLLRAVWMRTAW